MKQYTRIFAAALAIVSTAAACNKAELGAPVEKKLVKVSIEAQLPDTKAELQSDGKVFWQEGDKIAVYVGGNKFELELTEGAGTSNAIFSGETEKGDVTNAIYPASAAAAAYAAPKVPTAQTIAAGAICDPAALVMDGVVADGSISFKNVAGGVQVTVPAGTNRVSVVSGANAISAVVPGAGTYYIMIPVASFAGFTVAVATEDNHYFKSTDKTMEVTASKIFRLGDVTTTAEVVPNTVTSVADFVKWADNAEFYQKGETVTVAADIDLSTLNGGENYTWKPVTFAGNLEGAKKDVNDLYVIKGYQVKASEQDLNSDDFMYVGFFGYLSGGLKYLQFGTKGGHDAVVIADEYASVTSSYHVNIGGVVGRCKYGWLEGVKSCAEISMTEGANYKFRIGGIVGHFQSANSLNDAKYSMLNCTFDGSITVEGQTPAKTSYAGGIIGYSQAGIHLRSCTNLAPIKIKSALKYQYNIGGIAGQLASDGNGKGAIISNCVNGTACEADAPMLLEGKMISSTSTSTTEYAYIGGIVGMCYCTISHCFNYANIGCSYATKEPAGGKGSPRIGGICGYVTEKQPLTMDNCANFGTVYNGFVNNTRVNCGNLIGYGQKTTAKITNCLCAGNCVTEGKNDRATGFRAGVIVGCQAATGTYGSEEEPILVLEGLKIISSYTANPTVDYTIGEDNYTLAAALDGQTASGNVYHTALVKTVEEGVAKLVDRYAE